MTPSQHPFPCSCPLSCLQGTRVAFGASPPTAARVCRCLKVWRVCWCLPSLHEFAADSISPYTANISKPPCRCDFALGLQEPQATKLLWEPHPAAELHLFPVITSPCLAGLVSSITSSPLWLLLGCQGCHRPGLPTPCTPAKEKGSVTDEAGMDFDLSPSQHACCSARLLPFLSCSCLLCNYSAERHDVSPQLASLPGTVLGCQGHCP